MKEIESFDMKKEIESFDMKKEIESFDIDPVDDLEED